MKVVFILLDCVRYDYFGCNGNEEIYTPTIDALAEKGCNFKMHFSAAPWTSPSVASLLTGIYPHKLGMFKNHQSFPDDVKSLFKYYKQQERTVASFVKSRNFFGADDQANEAGCSWLLPQILDWMERNNDDDYFLYLHYWNTHLPYFTRYSKQAWYDGMQKLVESVRTGTEADVLKAKNLYKAAVERASEEFVYAVIEKLDKLNSLDDCLVVITADHGESWGERFAKKTDLDLFGMHGKFLYDEIIHVPLILVGPKIPSGRRICSLTGSVDIFPTLVELNGWDVDRSQQYRQIDGQSLVPVISGKEKDDRLCFSSTAYLDTMQEGIVNEVIQKYSCRGRHWKIIHDRQTGRYELYDLAADPDERRDISSREATVLQEYKQKLTEHVGDIGHALDDDEARIMADKLKDLGYM